MKLKKAVILVEHLVEKSSYTRNYSTKSARKQEKNALKLTFFHWCR